MSPGLRRPEMIPPREIAVGVVQVVTANLGATNEEIALSVSRLLGFKATSAQLRGIISQVVDGLVADGRLTREGAMLALPTTTFAPEVETVRLEESYVRS